MNELGECQTKNSLTVSRLQAAEMREGRLDLAA